MSTALPDHIVALDIDAELWEQCFTVAPLVLVGTRDASGAADLAPKHMVTAMGWGNYFGFVCTPRHGTYRNIQRSGEFTVSYPRPSQLLYTSLAAAPRCGDDEKPSLLALPTVPATRVDGVFIEDAYLFLECEHFKTVDGFGENSLVTGEIVAAYAHTDALRSSEWDDQELIHDAPLLAYLQPGRFASIDRSYSFPFPAGMKK
jgi:flavin reductase (DIM6/NTAB) family NADH-FMN oxidoreductase RutF